MSLPDDRPEALWQRLVRRAGYGLLFFLLYVLSIGPICYLYPWGSELPRWAILLYAPLGWFAEHTGLDHWIAPYLIWWMHLR